jgi:hypothetical protein
MFTEFFKPRRDNEEDWIEDKNELKNLKDVDVSNFCVNFDQLQELKDQKGNHHSTKYLFNFIYHIN